MANAPEYKKMVDPLLTLCDTAREDFIHVRHIPPSSSFVDLSLGAFDLRFPCGILWVSVKADCPLGVFASGLQALKKDLLDSGNGMLHGGITVEEAKEAIVFLEHGAENSIGSNELDTKAAPFADVNRGGDFKFTLYTKSPAA